jgi:protein arginine kinase activator
MKCQLCQERDATIHYIEIVEGQKASQWICTDCAEKEGIAISEVTKLMHGSLDAVLGDMLSSASGEKTMEKTSEQPVCDVCGFEYDRLQKKGRLGCPACYAAFRRQLLPVLRRYHGDVHHLGKSPKSRGPQAALRREISQLKLMLEQAVEQEVYEEAARLRDQIRDKERQVGLLGRDEDAESQNEDLPSAPSGGTETEV